MTPKRFETSWLLPLVPVAVFVTLLAAGITSAKGNSGSHTLVEHTCVEYEGRSRYVPYGYDHIVELHNACGEARQCDVSTNVNPKPQTVHLESEEKAEIVTFRGSPASEFQATVECKKSR